MKSSGSGEDDGQRASSHAFVMELGGAWLLCRALTQSDCRPLLRYRARRGRLLINPVSWFRRLLGKTLDYPRNLARCELQQPLTRWYRPPGQRLVPSSAYAFSRFTNRDIPRMPKPRSAIVIGASTGDATISVALTSTSS